MLVLIWLLGLWLIGWAALPVTRRAFAVLPDGGLAVARVLTLALGSLLAFWLATLHLSPLRFVPLIFGTLLLASVAILASPEERCEFLDFARSRRTALLASDAVFTAAFAFFLYLRWCNPNVSTLEKPMDVALLSAAWRTDWLPFQHPWLSGTDFTGYYSFGPLMAANLARCFGGEPPLAYNLAQAAFCALFVSTLFSLCASLCRTTPRALGAMALVALCGNFEPLRQWRDTGHPWPLNWWFTSRVVPDTINEYPVFTLAIGDAHAHFYALALGAAGLCVARALMSPERVARIEEEGQTLFEDRGPGLFVLAGLLLAVVAQTNPWDAPVFALLILLCAVMTLSSRNRLSWLWLVVPFVVARTALIPHLRTFHPAIGGISKELWLPRPEWLLMWGGWILLSLVAGTTLWRTKRRGWDIPLSPRARVCLVLAACGLVALLAPHGLTVLGVFADTPMRHQDTVFKFGLQAWVFLGTAAACGAVEAWARWPRAARCAALLFPVVPLFATASVFWGQIGEQHEVAHALDGASYLNPDDRAAVAWLTAQARRGDIVLEAAGPGSYTRFARVSALTGVPTVLGWPSHVTGWGASQDIVNERQTLIDAAFHAAEPEAARLALEPLKRLGVRWIFIGELERKTYPMASLEALRKVGKVRFESGETVVLAV